MGFHGATPPIVTEGLTFLVDAGDITSYLGSGTAWNDIAGTNNATLSGSPTFSSSNGGYFTFGSLSKYAGTSNPGVTGTTARTFIVWARTSTTTNGSFLSYGGTAFTGGARIVCGLGTYGGVEGVTLDVADGARTMAANTDDGKWHMYTWSFPASTTVGGVTMYQDTTALSSQAAGIQTNTSINTATTNPIRIGAHYEGSPYDGYYTGDLAIVQIYNTNLNATQVAQNYNALKIRFGL